MTLSAKVGWGVVGVLLLLLVGYLASRVGNIAARSGRDSGGQVELTVSEPVLPGVPVAARWTTALGEAAGPVVLRVRGAAGEGVVGRGEFAAGQAPVTIPCEMGGQEISLSLVAVPPNEAEQLVAWVATEVLPAGPDCLR